MVSRKQHDQIFKKNKFLFDRELLHDQTAVTNMDRVMCNWLDHYVKIYPKIQFVFWCEFAYHKRNLGKKHTMVKLSYPELYKRYQANAIDLDFFLEKTKMTFDESTNDDNIHLTNSACIKLLQFIRLFVL